MILKPINTAPKDRYILLFGDSGYMGTPLRSSVGRWCAVNERWNNHAGDGFTDYGEDATHWAVLPEVADPDLRLLAISACSVESPELAVNDPDWDTQVCSGWEEHVPPAVRRLWPTFDTNAKIAIFVMASELAKIEEDECIRRNERDMAE